MHFSIPDFKQFDSYVGYNIFLNGSFHCCTRYKQLHSLAENLRKLLPSVAHPSFPPKKLLTLSKFEIERRRVDLERFLQEVGQHPVLSKSNYFQTFLLNTQVETFEQDSSKQVEFDIFLLNGFRICCAVVPSECSQTVLKKALEKINLPENLWKYFCLYLIKEEDGRKTIIKRLMDFMESACVTLSQSQKVYQNEFKIVIRTNYWDRQTDLELMQNDVGLNLLTIQASSDFENGWLEPSNAVKNQLSNFQSNNMRKEFIKCCSVLPFYGCIQLAAIKTDFIENAQTIIIGNNELVIRDKTQETNFKVPRIKCWRVSTFTNEKDKSKKTAKYELSFEYLMAKNTLKWIKLVSEKYETICLISLSLQSMVDELLCKRIIPASKPSESIEENVKKNSRKITKIKEKLLSTFENITDDDL